MEGQLANINARFLDPKKLNVQRDIFFLLIVFFLATIEWKLSFQQNKTLYTDEVFNLITLTTKDFVPCEACQTG